MVELIRALGVFCETPSKEHVRLTRLLGFSQAPTSEQYVEIFLHKLPPYASLYTNIKGEMGGDAMERISGFWEVLRVDVPDEPDHLGSLLGLVALLEEAQSLEKEPARAVLIERSRAALFWEHLLPWLPMYLERVESRGQGTVYAEWAELLTETLVCEMESLGPLEDLPRHLVAASGLADPRCKGAAPFLASLFIPVRTGFILLPDDLSKLAEEVGISSEHQDQRSILEDLLRVAPKQTLDGLAEVILDRSHHWLQRWNSCGKITSHWKNRTEESVKLLKQLARDLEEGTRLA